MRRLMHDFLIKFHWNHDLWVFKPFYVLPVNAVQVTGGEVCWAWILNARVWPGTPRYFLTFAPMGNLPIELFIRCTSFLGSSPHASCINDEESVDNQKMVFEHENSTARLAMTIIILIALIAWVGCVSGTSVYDTSVFTFMVTHTTPTKRTPTNRRVISDKNRKYQWISLAVIGFLRNCHGQNARISELWWWPVCIVSISLFLSFTNMDYS